MENINRILLAGGFSGGIEGLFAGVGAAGGKVLGGLKGVIPSGIRDWSRNLLARAIVPLPGSAARSEVQRRAERQIAGEPFETTSQTFLRGLKQKWLTSGNEEKLLVETKLRRRFINQQLDTTLQGEVGNIPIKTGPLIQELTKMADNLDLNRAIPQGVSKNFRKLVKSIADRGETISLKDALRDKETIDSIFQAGVANESGALTNSIVQKKYANFLRGQAKDSSPEVKQLLDELTNLHNQELSFELRLAGPGLVTGTAGEEVSPFAGTRGIMYRFLGSPRILTPILQGGRISQSPLIGGTADFALRGLSQFGGREALPRNE